MKVELSLENRGSIPFRQLAGGEVFSQDPWRGEHVRVHLKIDSDGVTGRAAHLSSGSVSNFSPDCPVYRLSGKFSGWVG